MHTPIKFLVEVTQVEDNPRGKFIMEIIVKSLATNAGAAWDLMTVAWEHKSISIKVSPTTTENS